MSPTPPDSVRDQVRAQLEADVDAASWDLLAPEQVTRRVAAWLDAQHARCTDMEWAATFAHHCPVPGVGAAAGFEAWSRGRPGLRDRV